MRPYLPTYYVEFHFYTRAETLWRNLWQLEISSTNDERNEYLTLNEVMVNKIDECLRVNMNKINNHKFLSNDQVNIDYGGKIFKENLKKILFDLDCFYIKHESSSIY